MKIAALFIGWIGGWLGAAFCLTGMTDGEKFHRAFPDVPLLSTWVWCALGIFLLLTGLFCRVRLARA